MYKKYLYHIALTQSTRYLLISFLNGVRKCLFQSMATDPFLVVAIDFGTTYSGYAFQFRHEYSAKDPTVISAPQSWSDGTKQVLSLKTPTALLLNGDLEIDSFGYEAERKYSNLCEESKHMEWYFYRRFKMKLQNRGVSNLFYEP